MSFLSKQRLFSKLKTDKKYRDAFISSRISQTLALQVRILRQKARLSQQDLAKNLGTSQNAICRLENPKYGKANISTLKNIASFFNVGLIVRFAPVSEVAKWTFNIGTESMDVPSVAEDHGLDFSVSPTYEDDTSIGQPARQVNAPFPALGQLITPTEHSKIFQIDHTDRVINKFPLGKFEPKSETGKMISIGQAS